MRVGRWAVVLAVAVAVAACTPDDSDTVTVLAAASMSDAFAELADRYEDTMDGVTVRVAVAGSQRLATQVVEGAPADVFASADRRQMARVVDAGRVAEAPRVVARTQLVVAVPAGNPRDVAELADLEDPSLAVVLAAPEVPAGRYARQLLRSTGVDVDPASLETDVRGVLAKVALGEADAGIVYAADVVARDDDVDAVTVPDAHAVVATYPAAPLAEGPNPSGGAAFVAYLRGDAAGDVLARHGFRPGTGP